MPGGQFSHFRDKMSLTRDTGGHCRSIPGRSWPFRDGWQAYCGCWPKKSLCTTDMMHRQFVTLHHSPSLETFKRSLKSRLFRLCTKLSGEVYCYRSCLWACLQRAGWRAGSVFVCFHIQPSCCFHPLVKTAGSIRWAAAYAKAFSTSAYAAFLAQIFSVKLWTNMHQTDDVTLKIWPVTSRSPHMSVMRVIVLHPYTKTEVLRHSRSEDTADFWSRC